MRTVEVVDLQRLHFDALSPHKTKTFRTAADAILPMKRVPVGLTSLSWLCYLECFHILESTDAPHRPL